MKHYGYINWIKHLEFHVFFMQKSLAYMYIHIFELYIVSGYIFVEKGEK